MATQEEQYTNTRRRNITDIETTKETIDFGSSIPVQKCALRKKATTLELFLKSIIFFSAVFITAGVLSLLMQYFLGINKIFLFFLIGLYVSALATYYKFMVWLNPDYHPSCDCASSANGDTQSNSFIPSLAQSQDMMDGIFTVLGHKKSALLFNVPNTVWGILFYLFMIFINLINLPGTFTLTMLATIASCIGSVYLWYTMVCEVRSICVICSSIHAVSFLTLFSLLF